MKKSRERLPTIKGQQSPNRKIHNGNCHHLFDCCRRPFLAGVVSAIVAFLWWQRVRGFVQTAEQTEGTVIEIVESRGSKGSTTYSPVVEFTDRLGQRQEHRSAFSAGWQRYSVGDKVQILYEQNDPDATKINRGFELYFLPGLILFLAVDAIVMAIALLVIALFFV